MDMDTDMPMLPGLGTKDHVLIDLANTNTNAQLAAIKKKWEAKARFRGACDVQRIDELDGCHKSEPSICPDNNCVCLVPRRSSMIALSPVVTPWIRPAFHKWHGRCKRPKIFE